MDKLIHLKFKDIKMNVDYDVETCTFSFVYDGEKYSITRPDFKGIENNRAKLNFCIRCYIHYFIIDKVMEKELARISLERFGRVGLTDWEEEPWG